MSIDKRNQAEVIADNERLAIEARDMRVRLIQTTGKITQAPTLTDGKDILAVNDVLTAHFVEVARELFSATAGQGARDVDHVETIVTRNQLLQTELESAREERDAALKIVGERDSKIKSLEERYKDFDAAVSFQVAQTVAAAGISEVALTKMKGMNEPSAAVTALVREGANQANGAAPKEKVNLTAACLAYQAQHGKPTIPAI